jgi:hypothetical protein
MITRRQGSWSLIALCSWAGAAACSDGKSAAPDGAAGGADAAASTTDASEQTNVTPFVISLGDLLEGVPATPAEQTLVREIDISDYTLPSLAGELVSLDLDVTATAAELKFEPTTPGSGSGTVKAWIRIGGANNETVCETGECIGSFSVPSDGSGSLGTPSPAGALSATPNLLRLVRVGSFRICIGYQAPVPGTLSADGLSVRYGTQAQGCTEPPSDISGVWESSFSCDDSCSGTRPDQTNTLTITQDRADPTKASYTDTEGGSYSGAVCGNRFTFSGGGAGWTESGTFVLQGTGTATKTSQYSLDGDCCVGSCTDELTKQ